MAAALNNSSFSIRIYNGKLSMACYPINIKNINFRHDINNRNIVTKRICRRRGNAFWTGCQKDLRISKKETQKIVNTLSKMHIHKVPFLTLGIKISVALLTNADRNCSSLEWIFSKIRLTVQYRYMM